MAPSAWIHEIVGDDFKTTVIEGSKDHPVLADFWAPWCAPCRILGPILEKVVQHYEGQVHLAKINIDGLPALAHEYGIQSIPAVKLFAGSQIVEAFVGVQPEGRIRELIEPHLPNPDAPRVEEALALAHRGNLREALQILEMLQAAGSRSPRLPIALCFVNLLRGETQKARAQLAELPPAALSDPLHGQVSSLLHFASLLESELAKMPPGLAHRLSVGARAVLSGRAEAAIEQWLEAMAEVRADEREPLQEAIRSAFPLITNEARRLDFQRQLARSLH
jgi:putative thioredoxin